MGQRAERLIDTHPAHAGDLHVLEVLGTSDEVLPLVAAAALGTDAPEPSPAQAPMTERERQTAAELIKCEDKFD